MNDPQLEFTVHHWILRLLGSPRSEKLFLKDHGYGDDEVARSLNLPDPCHPYNKIKARNGLRKLIRQAGNLHEDHLPPSVSKSLGQFALRFKLNHEEARIYLLLGLIDQYQDMRDVFCMMSCKGNNDYIRTLGAFLSREADDIQRILNPRSTLFSSGLVKWGSNYLQVRNTLVLEVTRSEIVESILQGKFSVSAALTGVATLASPPTLKLRDFAHMQPLLDDLQRHLRILIKHKRPGGNCLLYGPPGTGKTELARALARSLRTTLFEICYEKEDHGPLPAQTRLENCRLAQDLLRERRTLLLFDECEDAFRGEGIFSRGIGNQHKAWLNRLLETNPVPIVWISNSQDCMDRAFLRRFDIIAEILPPPARKRESLYRKICAGTLSKPLIREISQLDQVTPAVVARAQSVATGLHAKGETRDASFSRLIEGTLRAQGHTVPPLKYQSGCEPLDFDSTLLNANPPLDKLIVQFDKLRSCRCLLQGLPGTGKSAFARWLAEERQSPLHIKRASDLLSPFLGATEQRLADAFRTAQNEQAVLMIDEIDTFLRDRRDAKHSWEASQVNEFLTCLESFEGIFICSTNLAVTLDPACLRRFDLKVRLDPLKPMQSRHLFSSYCRNLKLGRPTTSDLKSAAALLNATPGDYANAARQHRMIPFDGPKNLLEAITRECTIKDAHFSRRIGFG